jgi:hypothetical protein
MLTATEKFESFNGILRDASVHTNRQAPSRDIAQVFAGHALVRHIVSGGFWKGPSGDWIQCGSGILGVFDKKMAKKLLGLATVRRLPGSVTRHSLYIVYTAIAHVPFTNSRSVEKNLPQDLRVYFTRPEMQTSLERIGHSARESIPGHTGFVRNVCTLERTHDLQRNFVPRGRIRRHETV